MTLRASEGARTRSNRSSSSSSSRKSARRHDQTTIMSGWGVASGCRAACAFGPSREAAGRGV
eukprot:6934200-Prymnesium_polylepis.1